MIEGAASKWNWKLITSVFAVQFLLRPVVLSYGIYLALLEQQLQWEPSHLIWTPVVLFASWCIADPWFREITESLEDGFCFSHRWIIGLGVLFTSMGVIISSIRVSLTLHVLSYGLFAGLGTSLILTQVQAKTFDHFQSQPLFLQCFAILGSMAGLFTFPHILNLLYNHINPMSVIHGAILLNVLPASLLLGKQKVKKPVSISRYSSVPRVFNEDINLSTISDDDQPNLFDSKNWKNPSVIKLPHEEPYENADEANSNEPNTSRMTTIQGVEILPQIMEEDESDVDELTGRRVSRQLNNDIKRLSVISSKLEEIITRNDKREQNGKEVILDAGYIYTFPQNQHSTKRKSYYCCCSKYSRYHLRRKIVYIFDAFCDTCIKPLVTSCKIIMFYPACLSKTTFLLSQSIFLGFVPVLGVRTSNSMTESAFLLSMIAFASIVFLVTIPFLQDISKQRIRYLYSGGNLICSFGTYLVFLLHREDTLLISCLVYGLGLGMMFYTEEVLLKDALGVRKWSKVEGTLDTVSGIAILMIVFILNEIFSAVNEIEKWFLVIGVFHIVIAIVWVVYSFIMFFLRNKNNDRVGLFSIS